MNRTAAALAATTLTIAAVALAATTDHKKCTGKADCRSCTNCTHCEYCKTAGQSCGVKTAQTRPATTRAKN